MSLYMPLYSSRPAVYKTYFKIRENKLTRYKNTILCNKKLINTYAVQGWQSEWCTLRKNDEQQINLHKEKKACIPATL